MEKEGSTQVNLLRGPEQSRKPKADRHRISRPSSRTEVRRLGRSDLAWLVFGDHQIHAAGLCALLNPTKACNAERHELRHCWAKTLKSLHLTWGTMLRLPTAIFTGKDEQVSQFPLLLSLRHRKSRLRLRMRTGHLCLLALTERN